MAGLAIEGNHAAVSFNVHLDDDMQNIVAAQLIRLSRKCKASIVRDFLDSATGLKPVKLILKGKAGWDDNFPRNRNTEHARVRNLPSLDSCDKAAQLDSTHVIPISIIRCPKCKHDSVAQAAQLQQANLDLKIKCIHCCIRLPSRDWECNCGILWHVCKKHAPKAANHKAKGIPNIVASKASKRQLHHASIGQMLDDDLRRESKLAKCHAHGEFIMLEDKALCSALRPNMIPPKLRERFPDAIGDT